MKNSFNIMTISALLMLLMSGCGKEPETISLPKSVEAIPVKVVLLSHTEVTGSVHA
jgi:hypothetical protein